ncbi:MAG TPA: hypothetical protein VMF08_03640 [Candidatus Sulfotelmatobacter sp.]|nr:hypothetical protein [Candidatus Sulfotelmatobacter sp.]
MKRWALIVAALYVAILVVLTVPVTLLAFIPKVGWEAFGIYAEWPYWLCLAVMGISQFALLAVPVRLAGLRPVTRGPIWKTVLAGGLMAGALVAGACFSIEELVFADHPPKGNADIWTFVLLGLLTWFIWALVFLRISRDVPPSDFVTKHCRALFKGSILELLIAVPSHIVARCRDYCCAGWMTFIGLTMGISVMLFAFGPAVFFLFAERWKRLHPKPE